MCVCFLFQFLFIFYFEFWFLCGWQCHGWNDSEWASYYSVWASTSSLWSSWIFGVLNLQSPSNFRFYVSVSVLNNQASNLQHPRLHRPLSSTNRLHRYDSLSFNKYYSLLGLGLGFLIWFSSFFCFCSRQAQEMKASRVSLLHFSVIFGFVFGRNFF